MVCPIIYTFKLYRSFFHPLLASYKHRILLMLHSLLSSLPCQLSRLPQTIRRSLKQSPESFEPPHELPTKVVPIHSSLSYKRIVKRYSLQPHLVILTLEGLYPYQRRMENRAMSQQVIISRRPRQAAQRVVPRAIIRYLVVALVNQCVVRIRRLKSLLVLAKAARPILVPLWH